ncbi:MAG: AAA-like domain-containing protein [Pseudomonadota bacterium]
MREFNTFGPCDPAQNYVVPRTKDIADFIQRLKKGRYIVIFAPRQTGKTTFFRWALEALTNEDDTYLPIQLNFEDYKDLAPEEFYHCLKEEIIQEIDYYEPLQNNTALSQFLANYAMTSHVSMRKFFEKLVKYLKNRRVAIIIDEFDGIPTAEVKNFLHTLRKIYLSRKQNRCPYSLGIVGVKSITQLNYDRSISPFNIQDEFALSNFTLPQVHELLRQYTAEVGQAFAPEVIENFHKQTGGQPFLVNRLAQILTQEMTIKDTISNAHFHKAHEKILNEANVHLSHLKTNIRQHPRYETLLMEICSYQTGVRFNIHNDFISELVTYGVVKAGVDGYCEITNPIYQNCIVQIFQPVINGLERKYLPEDTEAGFLDYLTPDGQINMRLLLLNFRDFIARAGYRILQVPDTPQEFVGQYLLFAYLDQFVHQIRGFMYTEVRTGRGRMDLIIFHQGEKYIVETKIWEGKTLYSDGKHQLAEYLKLEGVKEGYYIVFDHRSKPQARSEIDQIEGKTIVSYCIVVLQEKPSAAKAAR